MEPDIVDQTLGHEIWTGVRDHQDVAFHEDHPLKLTIATQRRGDVNMKEMFLRKPTVDFRGQDDWLSKKSPVGLTFRTNIAVSMHEESFNLIELNAQAYTFTGAGFRMVARQEQNPGDGEWWHAGDIKASLAHPWGERDALERWASSQDGDVIRETGPYYEPDLNMTNMSDGQVRNEIAEGQVRIPNKSSMDDLLAVWNDIVEYSADTADQYL